MTVFPTRNLRLAVAGLLVLLVLGGCQEPKPGGAPGSEHAIHELREVTDRAEVEKLALQVIDGAKPLPGYQGLLAREADGLVGVVLAPEGWAQAAPKPGSADIMIFLLSVPDKHKKFKEPLVTKLRAAVSALNGYTPAKPVLMQPFILKPGGYDYPGQKVDTATANGIKGLEYWLEFPGQGRTVYVQAAGLPGFGSYFPLEKYAEFLKQLPHQAEGGAPASQPAGTPTP